MLVRFRKGEDCEVLGSTQSWAQVQVMHIQRRSVGRTKELVILVESFVQNNLSSIYGKCLYELTCHYLHSFS